MIISQYQINIAQSKDKLLFNDIYLISYLKQN